MDLSAPADVYVLCHEARGMDLSPGEQIFVSLRDTRRSDPEKLTVPGLPWHLRGVSPEAVLQVRAWAAVSEELARGPERRALGELRPFRGRFEGCRCQAAAGAAQDAGPGDAVPAGWLRNAFRSRCEEPRSRAQDLDHIGPTGGGLSCLRPTSSAMAESMPGVSAEELEQKMSDGPGLEVRDDALTTAHLPI